MKLKNTFFLLGLLLLSGLTYAQEKPNDTLIHDHLPRKGDVGVSIVVDGLIDQIQLAPIENRFGNNLLFAKYYIADDKALRFGFGLDIHSEKHEKADSIGNNLVELDSAYRQYHINLSFGYEKHIFSKSKLDPYLFSQIDLTFIGKKNTDITEITTSNAGERKYEKEIKRDGGFALGLSAGGGFNYFIANRFSIGAALAIQMQYVKEGGTISSNETTTPINGNPRVDFESREDINKEVEIGVRPNAQINLSYFF